METGVSFKETSSWTRFYDGEVVAVAQSGKVMLASDEKNGPRIVGVENNKAKEFKPSDKGSDVFVRQQSGAHAAFNPSSAICAAVLHYPRTSRPHKLVLLDTKTGSGIKLGEEVFVSGKSWESGKYCNPLIWLNDEMLGVFSSGDRNEAQSGIRTSLGCKNILSLYTHVCENSENDLFLLRSIEFNDMLIRAAHALPGDSFVVVHDDEKEGQSRSAIRVFTPDEKPGTFEARSFIFPQRFSSMGRVHISPMVDSGMIAVGASTESDIYLLDARSLSCVAKLTITDPLVLMCASPLKSYLLLVTEPESASMHVPKTVSLLVCGEPKKAKIAMSDECIDKSEDVSLISWTDSNDIIMKKNSELYGAALNVLMAKNGSTITIRKNSSNKKNLVEKLRGSFEKFFN